MTKSEDMSSNNTSQSEVDDGVMLDPDQPLHHTPVLVSMPTPSTSMPESNSFSMPPAMVLPPSYGGSSINNQNQKYSASLSGRSLLRPVNEIQDQSTHKSVIFGEASASFRTTSSALSSESEEEPSSEFFMKDSSERFMEEASMETSLADDSTPIGKTKKETLISPSGPMGRRRINGSINEKIVVSHRSSSFAGREGGEPPQSRASSFNISEPFTSGAMTFSTTKPFTGVVPGAGSNLNVEKMNSQQRIDANHSVSALGNSQTMDFLDSSVTRVASKIERNEPIRSRPDSTTALHKGKRSIPVTSAATSEPMLPICSSPQEAWDILRKAGIASSEEVIENKTYVGILHWIFSGWTYPELSIDQIQCLWDSETQKASTHSKEATIPEQIMLHANSHSRPLRLILENLNLSDVMPSTAKGSAAWSTKDSSDVVPLFWSLPAAFCKVFLQILCRLINPESSFDFERRLFGSEKRRRHPHFLSPMDHEPPKTDVLYTIARLSNFKILEKENGGGGKQLVLPRLLSLVKHAMESLEVQVGKSQNQKAAYTDQHRHYADVLPSLIYLLGIWGVGGITPLVLRKWLSLIVASGTDYLATTTTTPVVYRDGLVRALTFATHHGSLVVPPRNFFCFRPKTRSSPGLKRAIKGLPHWPFRNDFGFATWFRCEHAHHRVQLLSVRTDQGAGWTVSLNPLAGSGAYSLVISVYDSGDTAPSNKLSISGCVLVPRNWYHLAIRHTRSRLKGVFSLSTRQHLVLLLDGKVMTNQSLPFPKVEQGGLNETTSLLLSRTSVSQAPSRLNLEIEVAADLEGETGPIYIFKDNVADGAFRSLYEATGGTDHRKMQRADSHASLFASTSWDARHSDIVRKSRVLDHSIKNDDADEIVLSSGNGVKHKSRFSQNGSSKRPLSIIDFDEPELDGDSANLHQDLALFESKIFVVWDPQRSMDSMAFELHVGAHVILDEEVHVWQSCSPQDAISSIGGVQALIPLFRSMIAVGGGAATGDDLSILANLFYLLAAFVRGHAENARELLRCGGIDVIEQLLFASKRIVSKGSSSLPSSTRSSLFAVLCANEFMATELVESLLFLRSSSQHYVGLETKVFARLLFNLPLWFGQNTNSTGAALHLTLLPALSFLTKTNPAKVRECIGAKDMIHLLREMALAPSDEGDPQKNRFLGDSPSESSDESEADFTSMFAEPLAPREKRHVRRIVLGMILQVLSRGTTSRDLGPLLRFISMTMEKDNISMGHESSTLRHLMQLEMCTILLLLLQLSPPVPGLHESLAQCCGSVQAVVGWMMAVMAKSSDEKMIGLAIRCVFAYILVVAKKEDQPLSQTVAAHHDDIETNTTEVASTTVALASSTVASLAKGIASTMGPAGRTMVFSPSKLTPRVVYKLLWHLLKTRQAVLGEDVHSALVFCMSDARESLADTMLSADHLLQKLVIHAENAETSGCWFSYDVAMSMLQKSGSIVGRSLQNTIVIATVLRLLAFLPPQTKQQWLSDLLLLVRSSRNSMAMVSSMEDWQSCLFQLFSETIDELAAREKHAFDDAAAERLDLCLELYATLLGHLLREGGEKALDAVEHAASLQRICVNGQVVLLLILSALCSNLFDHGTLLEVGSLTAEDWKDIDLEHDSLLLKQSAKLVTDAILSNGTEGLDMNEAVKSWRSLRHLAEVVVALVSKSGLGVVDLFAYNKQRASAVDSITGGMHGIRLSENRLHGVSAQQYIETLVALDGSFDKTSSISDDLRRDIDRRLCVGLAAQVLTLLDAFIFPESLDTSLPASQVHGLALVRNSEPRLGAAQGPLIASAIKLSFLLMSSLEPCSVRMLQCVSRLRCLVQWALDLIRESQGTPLVAFDEKVAVLDRLLLAVILHCHRVLGRCAALLSQLESSSSDKNLRSKDLQKKHYRRLVRVALELRSVVSTTYRGRNPVMAAALSSEAIEELRASLEGSSAGANRSSSKEVAAKDFLNAATEFLGSRWVSRFQDVEIRGDLSVPEQVTMDTIVLDNDSEAGRTGIVAIEKLAEESLTVQSDFEKAIDLSFGGYLESERKWSDAENVRDLECEGDATRKKLADKQETDVVDIAMEASNRRIGADHRWNGIQRKAVSPWADQKHFRVADFPDRLGRRTLLVQNRSFTTHNDAAYDTGKGSSIPDTAASSKGGSDLTDLIRRNAEAFTVEQSRLVDDDSLVPSSDDSATDQESLQDTDSLASDESEAVDATEAENEDEWDKIDQEEIKHVDAHGDVDGWAKAFIWSENESVVARFDEVMIVSLQSTIEGKVLLTTHGLYFNGTGNEINIMTKQPVDENSESKDRRWRLSRLTEIHGRRYLLRQQAIELFFADCNELLLNFPRGGKERDRFHAKLRNSCKIPLLWSPKSLNPRIVFRKSRLTELWRKRKISNFEYLMALNRMAGRSFNDITQYPVFPWILSDYTSEDIDLSDSRVYRDLSKPIGALNPDRLAQLLERYKDLELFGFPEAERFLYGSHYNSPGIVLHLLMRQEPFTTMHIQLQSGRIDCPDRLFFDVAASWDGCMTSSSDMKELVPEFFCLPEMFLNTNKFPLGRMQSGRVVDDVGLPPWAKGSAYEFVRIQRQALESEYVSQNLHHWIDLIFGYKQRGEEAEAAHNIFHHLSYEGSVDLDKITDEVDRAAAESHIQNFGQTPSQLLPLHPHPERYFQEECWKPLIQTLAQSSQLRFYTPSRQFGNANSEYAKGPIVKVFALSDAVVAVYGDMSIGSYRWFPTYKSNRLRMDRLRPLTRRELSTARDAMKRGSLVAPDELAKSDFFMNSSSLALTIGGRLREDLRRNAIMPSSRLMAGTETTITSAEASSMIIGCGFWDESVKVHSLETLRGIASETGGHRGPIHCLAVSFDGFLVSGGKDCTCRVWVVDHPDMAVAMSDGYIQTALGVSQDGESILTCCHVLWGHETPVISVDVNSDLDVVVSGSTDGRVCIHTMRRGEFIRSFHPPALQEINNQNSNHVLKVALDSSGNIAVHMADHGLHIFTVNGVKLASVDAGEKLNDMIWNGEFLITGGTNGKVIVRKLATLEACCLLDLSKHGPINTLALTPDELNPVGQYLFVGSDDGSVSVVDENPNHSTATSS